MPWLLTCKCFRRIPWLKYPNLHRNLIRFESLNCSYWRESSLKSDILHVTVHTALLHFHIHDFLSSQHSLGQSLMPLLSPLESHCFKVVYLYMHINRLTGNSKIPTVVTSHIPLISMLSLNKHSSLKSDSHNGRKMMGNLRSTSRQISKKTWKTSKKPKFEELEMVS